MNPPDIGERKKEIMHIKHYLVHSKHSRKIRFYYFFFSAVFFYCCYFNIFKLD